MIISIGLPIFVAEAVKAEKRFHSFSSFLQEGIPEGECRYFVSAEIFLGNLDFFFEKRTDTAVFLPDADTDPASTPAIFSLHSTPEQLNELLGDDTPGIQEKGSGSNLSVRETEVLKEIASGKTFKEIADTLSISTNTVMTHRKNISAKLGIRSISGLSLYALMNGII